jgi:hypothetical protein
MKKSNLIKNPLFFDGYCFSKPQWFIEVSISQNYNLYENSDLEIFTLSDQHPDESVPIITMSVSPDNEVIVSISCNEETPLELVAKLDEDEDEAKILFGKLNNIYYLSINGKMHASAKAEIEFGKMMKRELKINNFNSLDNLMINKFYFCDDFSGDDYTKQHTGNWLTVRPAPVNT